jgi:hypothetical protein
VGYLHPGTDTGGIPVGLVKAILSAGIVVPNFVETGTAGGDSVKTMAPLFRTCRTIDIINPRHYRDGNITYYRGESVCVLPKIIKYLSGWTLFWLDAHCAGDKPNDSKIPECPLMQEIEIISKHKDSIILIDDARLFFGVPVGYYDPRQWPCIDDVFTMLRLKFPWHETTIIDDYIFCYSPHFKIQIDQEWQDRFHIRYPNAEERKRLAYKFVYQDAMKNFEYFKKWIEIE